ncbi:NDR1/HIN1-like protein 13 [Silene latifolia]|uniref:NDR1/HIN1-like protein 13 n=1 Tax=Silene latifolia TaxID=37657 RepID=UPI003D77CF27
MSELRYPRESTSKPIIETPPVSGEYPKMSTLKPIIETPPVSGEHQRDMSRGSFGSSKSYDSGPNPGTYVIQLPKDQIFRVPPPENAHKFKRYTKRNPNRNYCRSCICYMISIILLLIILLGITFGILYLIYRPKIPTYTINGIQIKGVNLTAAKVTATTITPVFNITVKTDNRNGKISIYYEQGSKINIYRDGVNFCDGELPAFYQPPKSVTVFSTELSGSGIVLSKSALEKLLNQQKNGKVPLEMDVKVPVRIKLGSVKFWTMTVKVKCDVAVNALTVKSKVVSQKCKVRFTPW